MTTECYYRGRALKDQLTFDFTGLVSSTPKNQLEKYFVDLIFEKGKPNDLDDIDKIELNFLKDTLSKIRSGLPLVSVTYQK